jgi:hypothetical protein
MDSLCVEVSGGQEDHVHIGRKRRRAPFDAPHPITIIEKTGVRSDLQGREARFFADELTNLI